MGMGLRRAEKLRTTASLSNVAPRREATPETIGETVSALGDEDENVRWLASSTLASLKDER